VARACAICGKIRSVGVKYERRGLAKKKGGAGRKITGKTKRTFEVNLQTVRANVGGTIRRIRVCTKCIRAGRVTKAAPHLRAADTGAQAPVL